MTRERVAKLYREIQLNQGLFDTLNTAPSPESFVSIANQRGGVFTFKERQEMTQFSVEELEGNISEIP